MHPSSDLGSAVTMSRRRMVAKTSQLLYMVCPNGMYITVVAKERMSLNVIQKKWGSAIEI